MGTDKRERQKANRQERLQREQRETAKKRRNRSVRNLAIFSVLIFGVLLWLSGRGGDDTEVATDAPTTTAGSTPTTTFGPVPPPPGAGAAIRGETPCPAEDGTAQRTTIFEQAPPMCLEEGVDYVAVIETSAGQVQVALDTESAPITANNFAVLARYHYYAGTALFRTDPSIDVIQGGSPHTNNPGDQGPGYTIPDEGDGFTYEPGDLVMARTPQPNSASAQFFFAAGPNVANLNASPEVPGTGTYVRFGRVISGLDILEQILASHVADPTSSLGGYPDPPVVLLDVTIVPADEAPTPGEPVGGDAGGTTTTAPSDVSTTTAPEGETDVTETIVTTTTIAGTEP